MDISSYSDEELKAMLDLEEIPTEELLAMADIKPEDKPMPMEQFQNIPGMGRPLGTSGVSSPTMGPMGTEVISTLDTKPGVDFQAESRDVVEGLEGVGRGVARFPLGVAKLGTDMYSLFGSDEYAQKAESWIKANEKYIEDNGLEGEALFGEIATAIALPSSYLRTGIMKLSAVAGAEVATTELGSGESYFEAAKSGATAAAIGGAVGLGLNKIIDAIGPLSKESQYLVNRITTGMPEEEAAAKTDEIINILKDIPKEHQAYALANMAEGRLGLGNIKKAISDDTALQAKLNFQLRDRAKIATAKTAGNSDVGLAQAKWSDMLTQVEQQAPEQFSTNSIRNSLDYVSNIYGLEGTSRASQLVRTIKAETSQDTLSLSQALNVRKGINELLRKAPRGSREITEFNKIKTSIDSFIESATKDKPELGQLIKETTSEYARVVNNKQFNDIVKKHTSRGVGVNWEKVVKDVNKAGLNSPEVKYGINVAKEFEKKFGLDAELSSAAIPSGVDPAAGGLLFFWTKMSNFVRDVTSPLTNYDRYTNLKIQNAIIKSIRSEDDITKIFTNLSKNSDLPDEVKLGLERISKEIPPSLKTGSEVLDNPEELAKFKQGEIDLSKTPNINAMTNVSKKLSEAGDSASKAVAEDISSNVDDIIDESITTGKSIQEVTDAKVKANSTSLGATETVKETPEAIQQITPNSIVPRPEYINNLINGDSELLRSYDEVVSGLKENGYEVFSRTTSNGNYANYVRIDDSTYRLDYVGDRTSLARVNSTVGNWLMNNGDRGPARTLLDIRNSANRPIQSPEFSRAQSNLESKLLGKQIAGKQNGRDFNMTIDRVEVVRRPNGGVVFRFGSNEGTDGAYFGITKKANNVYKFDATNLPNGGNMAFPVYRAAWDLVKDLGGKYVPDSTLTGANKFRLAINMLRYAEEAGWDNVRHLHLKNSMVGYHGNSQTLVLTKENLKKYNLSLINNYIKPLMWLPESTQFKNLSDSALEKLIDERLAPFGSVRNEFNVTKSAIKDLVRFMKSHSPRTPFAVAPFLLLMEDKELKADEPINNVKQYFADIESYGGKYDAYNEGSKAYGKYQITPIMMKDLGITKQYLEKPENQEKVIDTLLNKYSERLVKYNLPNTKENLFVLHNLGMTGGIRVLLGKPTEEDVKNMANQLPDDVGKETRNAIIENYKVKYGIDEIDS